MVVQPDGKIAMAGSAELSLRHCYRNGCRDRLASYPALVRFNADGSLDPGFGLGGGLIDLRHVYGISRVPPLTIGAGDGLLVGRGPDVAAYDADGSIDREFGRNGVSPLELPLAFGTRLPTPRPAAFASLPDGRTALAGTMFYEGKISLLRGSVELVAADGVVPGSIGLLPGMPGSQVGWTTVEDVVAGPNGLPLVAGTFTNGVVPRGFLAPLAPSSNWSEGTELPAGSFTDLPDHSSLAAAARDGDATIVAGEAGELGVNVLLARVNAAGERDPAFGEGGVAIDEPFPGAMSLDVSDVALQPDGKILVAGRASAPCAAGQPSSGRCRVAFLERFEADGKRDAAFAENGRFRLGSEPVRTFNEAGVSVYASADGSILLGDAAPAKGGFVLARLTSTGQLEPAFGESGIASAEPCQGSVSQLRAQGCLSTVKANLTVKGVSRGRPTIRLFARTSTPLDPVSNLHLKLPKPMRARGKEVSVHPVLNGHRAVVVAHDRTVIASELGWPQRLRLTVPPRLLRSPQGFPSGRKLVFHLRVDLFDGSRKWIRIVRRSR